MLPYSEWPCEPHRRWIAAGNAFGAHLIVAAVEYAIDRIPADADSAARDMAAMAARDAAYGAMMLLDGLASSDLGPDFRAEYVLTCRVRSRPSCEVVEAFELAPDGDGLCMGFHGWLPDGLRYVDPDEFDPPEAPERSELGPSVAGG
ncbi:MAG: hypothetical protein ACRC1K_26760 [Planctomycetia bacterium]